MARGQLLGRPDTVHRVVSESPHLVAVYPYLIVRVPRALAPGEAITYCFAFDPTRPASCAKPLGTSQDLTEQRTYVGRYPPLYYALVGWPSLFAAGATGIYLERLLTAAFSALFIATAFTTLLARRRSTFTSLALLLTFPPAAIAIAGAPNPAGLENAAALACWASLLALAGADVTVSDKRLVRRAGIAAAVLALLRGLSPVWVVLIVLTAVAVFAPERRRVLWARRDVRLWSAAAAGSTAAATAWIIATNANQVLGIPPPKSTSTATIVSDAFGRTWTWATQAVANWGAGFGPSMLVVVPWLALIAALLVGALVATASRLRDGVSTARPLVVLVGLLATCVLLPVAVTIAGDRSYGPGWQGRYIWPLAIGLPLLAGIILDDAFPVRSWHSRLAKLPTMVSGALVITAVAAVTDLVIVMRRYMVGTHGPIWFFDGPWQPPVPPLVLVLAAMAAQATLVALAWSSGRATASGRRARRSPRGPARRPWASMPH